MQTGLLSPRFFSPFVLIGFAMFATIGTGGPVIFPGGQYAYAAEVWRAEFDEVCAKTQDAMALSKEELQGFINRCDRLKPRIETLEETEKKVFLKRLKMCRDLYQYVLESKDTK